MPAARTFSLQGCTGTFLGYPLSGFTPDDAITIEPSNAAFESVTGADGDLSRAQKAVSYKVKVSLAQTSKCNDTFSAIHKSDILFGTGVGPFVFVDERGTSVCALSAAYIVGEPSAAYGTSIKTREWNFEGVGTNFIGGN